MNEDVDERDPKLDPREGDSAVQRGITWAVVSIDARWIQLTNRDARRGSLKTVSLAEWQAGFKNHRRSGGR